MGKDLFHEQNGEPMLDEKIRNSHNYPSAAATHAMDQLKLHEPAL
jgi:hypothetical protein